MSSSFLVCLASYKNAFKKYSQGGFILFITSTNGTVLGLHLFFILPFALFPVNRVNSAKILRIKIVAYYLTLLNISTTSITFINYQIK